MKFVILSKNEYFGFEEIIDNTKRNHRVVCCSQYGEVSIVTKKEFMRRFWGDPKTKQNLIRIITRNNEIKQSRINEMLAIESSMGILRKPTDFDEFRIEDEEPFKSKMFDSINSGISFNNINTSVNFNSTERKSTSSQKPQLSDSKNNNLKHFLYKKKFNVSSHINKNFFLNKLKTSLTFHEHEPGSMIKLEDSNDISKKLRTEISQIHDTTNLMNFVQSPMNLHRKLKSLDFNLKTMNLNESYITNRRDVMQDLRSSFKPIEIVKLKAFQQLNEKQKEFEIYNKFSMKKKIEDYQSFFVPKIVQRKLNEKVEIKKTLAKLNSKIETTCKKNKFISILTEEKLLEVERRRGENRKHDCLKKENGEHHRVRSLITMNRDLLPLKYNIGKYEKKKVVFNPHRICQN